MRSPPWVWPVLVHSVAIASVGIGATVLYAIESHKYGIADAQLPFRHLISISTLVMALSFAVALFVARDARRLKLKAEKAFEQLIRETEERLRAEHAVDTFFSLSVMPMCVLGFDGKVQRINRAWEALLEFEAGAMAGRMLIESVYKDDLTATRGMLEDLEHGARVIGFENRMTTSTGALRWLNWSAVAIADQQVYMINAKDITIRKLKEAQTSKNTAKLERSNADLERFAFMASHDLQEPLRMVASYAQQLTKHYKGQLDPRADRYIAYVVDGALRMQGMISSLLTYSRFEQCEAVFEPVACGDAVGVALRNLQTALQESEAVVTTDVLPTLHADASLLTHLFQNLIANAIKFCGKEAPHVHVSAKAGEGEWIFGVEDQGIGIRVEDSERVFGLFQRLHSKTEYPGSGMGLAICQKIVQRHGGKIWVDSEVGKGSRFYFSVKEQMNVEQGAV